MQPAETVPPASLGHPVLDALHRASRPDVADAVFERDFLARLTSLLHAQSIVIWFDPGGETLYVRYKRDLPLEELQRDPEGWKKHGQLLKALGNRGEPCIVPAGYAEEEAANPTSRELLIASAVVLQGQLAIVEVFRDPALGMTRSPEQDMRLLQVAAYFAADRVRAQQAVLLTQSQMDWRKVDRFAQQVHATLELEPAAYVIANEAAALLGCDRVTVAIRHRRRAIVKAISGQTEVNRRSNLIRLQERLGEAALTSPSAVIVGPRIRQYEPPLDEVVSAYLHESGAKTLFAIPLRLPPQEQPVGVLFIEQFDERVSAEQMADRVGSVATHAATALQHALAQEQVFLGRWRRRLGRLLAESLRLRTLVLLALLGGLLTAMVRVQVPLRMEAHGELRAQVRRGIFATEAGTVRAVSVDHGDAVRAGQPVAVLENHELQVQLQQTREELSSAVETLKIKEVERENRQTAPQRRIQLDGEIAELQERISFLHARSELLRQRIASLTLTAPIDGIVATWDPRRQLLDRPVAAGNLLLTVVQADGPWQLELRLPEIDAGPVLRAWHEQPGGQPLPVEFQLATHPEARYRGTLAEVAIRTETLEERPTLQLTVLPDPAQLPPLRDGAEVRAKIDCGPRSLGYVLLRELIEFVQSRILFRF